MSDQLLELPASAPVNAAGVEWLTDNLHIVRETIDQVAVNLPRNFVRKLPAIRAQNGDAIARIRDLADIVVERAELPLELSWIKRFVTCYQVELRLTLGELWALPTMLRIVVVEHLLDTLEHGVSLPAEQVDDAMRDRINSMLSGAILSLRMLAASDWYRFVEHLSVVERALADDPSGHYPRMDAQSRNRYREHVESLARRLGRPEWQVADTAVELCRAPGAAAPPTARHVGYYLVGRGLPHLLTAIRGRRRWYQGLAIRVPEAVRTLTYMLAIIVPTVLSLLLLWQELARSAAAPWAVVFLVLCAFVPVLTFWAEIGNWLATQCVRPDSLPKMDFTDGIPDEHRTIVAIPCMLTSETEIDRVLQNLEINYLGNDDPVLSFVLLSDYLDAAAPDLDSDRVMLSCARNGIDALNERYGTLDYRPFALCHRHRLWNENAGLWMGWERKRGKIDEFNRWLLGDDATSFSELHGDHVRLRKSRYVITLDADNQLLPDAAAELAGTLAHPLNRPQFDPDSGRVTDGYTVIQPRVDIHPASANRTAFSRVMSGEVGIDLYHQAVSEVYQDLFAQGTYAGKGIYDIRAFAQSVAGRVPANTVLSHDLLEGVLGRAALATDIVVLENASPNLIAELRRQHRWVRGDWQLLPWLIPLPSLPIMRRTISVLGRLKLAENLRRSLLPPSLLVMLLGGWWLMPGAAAFWSLAVMLIPALPIFLAMLSELRFTAFRWGTLRSSVLRVISKSARQVVLWFFNLAALPIVAANAGDAIVRTLLRLLVTRRNLLEWIPSAHSESDSLGAGLIASYRRLWAGPAAGALAYASGAMLALPGAWPWLFGTLWTASPLIAWRLAREMRYTPGLPDSALVQLRLVARRTWRFYERFVGPETHWLPPDNFQEAPTLVVAERTSPTNIGLFLAASVAAHQLGYIGARGLLMRIDGTTSTIERLPQFRGHLFNWYDTRDLAVLPPDYISTVDSGNLLASLHVCRTALQEIDQSPLPHHRATHVLGDIVANIEETIDGGDRQLPAELATVASALDEISRSLAATPDDPDSWSVTLAELCNRQCIDLDRAVLQFVQEHNKTWSVDRIDSLRSWIVQLRDEASDLLAAIERLLASLPATSGIPTAARELNTLQDYWQLLDAHAATGKEVNAVQQADQERRDLLELRDRLQARIAARIEGTDFGFLFDRNRKLFHIGYNNATGNLDSGYYDLLASEARIASLVAIAKGDVPVSHWVHLGRPLRRLGGMRVILSWSATAFEYLMPRLFMQSPPHGLLDTSCRAIIREQRRQARHRHLPWGVSESAFFALDNAGNYQYYAFGTGSLALRQSRQLRYVVSPYASALALPFDSGHVLENFAELRAQGCWGRYGFYEALDFGESPADTRKARVVQCFMAHHQGMILAALANAICADAMPRMFHANPEIRAVEHLLYEALPNRAQDRIIRRPLPVRPRTVAVMTADHVAIDSRHLNRFINVLGNGHLTMRCTGRGGGDLAWNDRAITRWQPRVTGAGGGDRVYLTLPESGAIHVIGEPGVPAEIWAAPFQTELHQHLGSVFARLTSGIAPDNDVAIKRITLTNESEQPKRLIVTSFAEMALAPRNEDQRHPAFNKLFIQSRPVADGSVLLFNRRRRHNDESGLYCAVGIVGDAFVTEDPRFITDRRVFIGPNGSYRRPAALLAPDEAAHPAVRDTLDPVAAVSVTITLPPAATTQLAFLTAVAPDQGQAVELVDHFQSLQRIAFSFDQARSRAATELTRLNVDSPTLVRRLADYGRLVWPDPFTPGALSRLRATDSIIGFLWSRGISGDNPVCLVCLQQDFEPSRAQAQLVLQTWLGHRGIAIDVVFLDEAEASYAAPQRARLEELIDQYREGRGPGRVFVLAANQLSPAECIALEAAALLHRDVNAPIPPRAPQTGTNSELPAFVAMQPPHVETPDAPTAVAPPDAELLFDNGYGGIDAASGDYVMRIAKNAATPAPWVNVLANPDFGCIVSARGSSTTWYRNASEHRLTPWYNDPVTDRSGEALYIRDEETGEFWSPTPSPAPADGEYRVRHGAGFTTFELTSHDLEHELCCFVDQEQAAKVSTLKLRNFGNRPRRLTVTCFAEWVLGNHYEDTSPFIFTELAGDNSVLLARNASPRTGNQRVAFLTATAPLHGFTTDRREFLGEARDMAFPAGLRRIGLSGITSAGAEPCAAFQIHLDFGPGQSHEVSFVLGAAETREAALELAAAVCEPGRTEQLRAATTDFWREQLARCVIRTPNQALNYLFNRWLMYQTLAARLWGRTGYYQSAGGFGFRDQLQDALGLVSVAPELARQHLLNACRVQFPEGDVLHWWHEGPTRGVRSRCSDDLLWLPYAASEYLAVTGDQGLLGEQVAGLVGEPLRPGEHERYTEFATSDQSASLYEHCNLAIDARQSVGAHGLPFIGTGDWNDGLNRVGIEGRGESVWLGWFLADVYTRFADIAAGRGESGRAADLLQRREALFEALERHGWDGNWYRRAYYDDGKPLGTADDAECRIDLNAQTWPVITGLADPARAARAFRAAEDLLIDDRHRLIKLLAPPFDVTAEDPGYIKGYPPGVRENGGQYTHASAWAVWAAAELRKPDTAMRFLDLLNPLLRVTDSDAADQYLGEPYVLAGDVYASAPRTGQAGWTWYTGSASWLYRIILEWVLGIRVRNGELQVRPCVPESWSNYEVDIRAGSSCYTIEVRNACDIAATGATLELDGRVEARVVLRDDGADHRVLTRAADRQSGA